MYQKLSLLEPSTIVDADGKNDAEKIAKSITWPAMDDDALPSSYIMRVLTCVSKWSVKMVGLTDMIASLEKTSDSLTQFHDLICKTFGIPVCAPVCLSVCVEVLCVMLKEQYAGQTQPRLSGRAKDIHAELESLTEKIGNLNASGIMTGFHAAQLRPNL